LVSLEGCLADPPASSWTLSCLRRSLDIAVALSALVVLALPMLVLAICVRLTSKGDALFYQERVGLGGRLFRIYKFRSMEVAPAEIACLGLTMGGDDRVTSLGRWMRMLKLDELPQFFNILRGDMSLVGPRPMLPRYAAMFNMPYRPGVTGLATLLFCHEEEVLRDRNQCELDRFYVAHIRPLKARLDVCYMCKANPLTDARVIASTLLACLAVHPGSTVSPSKSSRIGQLVGLKSAVPSNLQKKPASYMPEN
jgi:lipopolysaccharide/colanic/teichoic acid biosynthesis glycosyltransferase